MLAAHPGEVSHLVVRVNPRNGDFVMDDPAFIQSQIDDHDSLKETLVDRLRKGIGDGTLPMECGSDEGVEEADILFTAEHMTQRALAIRAALGGYGLFGKVDSLNFHGVEVEWIGDEEVAVGEFEFVDVEDRVATMNYLTTIMP